MSGIVDFVLGRFAKRLDLTALDQQTVTRRRTHLETHVRFVDRWSSDVPLKFGAEGLTKFLSRLNTERPHLIANPQIGMALLALFHQYSLPRYEATHEVIETFVAAFALDDAVMSALPWYTVDSERPIGEHRVVLLRKRDIPDRFGVIGFGQLRLQSRLFKRFLTLSPIALTYRNAERDNNIIIGGEAFLE